MLSPRKPAALFLLLASAASAQTSPSPELAAEPDRGRGQIFLAPSGEPFHARRDEPYPVAAWFARADADHDGRLTLAEFTADFERFFKTLDQDGDGRLRSAEVDRYEQEVAPEVQAYESSGFAGGGGANRGGGGGGGRGHGRRGGGGGMQSEDGGDGFARATRRSDPDRPVGGGRFGLLNIPEPVASMDTDLDGSVTSDELRRAAIERFRLLDASGKGYLTLDTLPKTWVQQMGSRAEPHRGGRGGRGILNAALVNLR